MRCILILIGFVICAASSPVTNMRLQKINVLPKNPQQINRNVKVNYGDLCFAKLKNPYKSTNRKTRSIWTRFINDIAATVERHQMKPLLAKGINDVDDFGKNIKNKLHETPKSANVMLNEDTGTEDKSKAEVERHQMKPLLAEGINDVGDLGKNIKNKLHETPKSANVMLNEGTGAEDKSEPEVINLGKLKDNIIYQRSYPRVDRKELKKIKNQMKPLEELVKVAEEHEKKFIKYLENNEKFSEQDIVNLLMNGPNHKVTRKRFDKIFFNFPELKPKLMTDAARITELRQKIKDLAEKFTKISIFHHHIPDEELFEIKGRLIYILQTNNTWLRGSPHPTFNDDLEFML